MKGVTAGLPVSQYPSICRYLTVSAGIPVSQYLQVSVTVSVCMYPSILPPPHPTLCLARQRGVGTVQDDHEGWALYRMTTRGPTSSTPSLTDLTDWLIP